MLQAAQWLGRRPSAPIQQRYAVTDDGLDGTNEKYGLEERLQCRVCARLRNRPSAPTGRRRVTATRESNANDAGRRRYQAILELDKTGHRIPTRWGDASRETARFNHLKKRIVRGGQLPRKLGRAGRAFRKPRMNQSRLKKHDRILKSARRDDGCHLSRWEDRHVFRVGRTHSFEPLGRDAD